MDKITIGISAGLAGVMTGIGAGIMTFIIMEKQAQIVEKQLSEVAKVVVEHLSSEGGDKDSDLFKETISEYLELGNTSVLKSVNNLVKSIQLEEDFRKKLNMVKEREVK